MRYACLMRKLFLAAIPLMVGCGAPYKFVAHAEPNPFTRPGCRAVIEPLHVEHLIVGEKPVQQYAAEKSAESADSFDNDLRASNMIFHDRIAEEHGGLFMPGTPDNTFVIRPVWIHWEPGSVFSNARAGLLVDVIGPNNSTLDRISIETTAGDYSSGGRMRLAMKKAGRAVSVYISDNWVCDLH
jgi:hypothetical protein